MTDIEIERLIRVFRPGVTRRNGIHCDAMTCSKVLVALRELKRRAKNETA
jgi:hypothetical protein